MRGLEEIGIALMLLAIGGCIVCVNHSDNQMSVSVKAIEAGYIQSEHGWVKP